MSLLLNEDFTLYNLRLGYLQTINDGVGERLITLNPAVLSDPAFKAAGFAPDQAAIKRCYSPPIPTTGAAEYFTRPATSRPGFALQDGETPDEEAGGLITGHRTSEDTLGPTAINEKERRRRRERERMEEDDSSDLSDDSDDEETAVQGVRFAKVKQRKDSSLSPPRLTSNNPAGPEVHIISPSFRPRTSSLGAQDALRGVKSVVSRPRGDTITSSEFSSESEMLDVSTIFKRKLPSRPQKTAMLASKIAEEDAEESDLEDDDEEEDVEVAEASDLSDDFEGDDVAVPSPDFLGAAGGMTSSPLKQDASFVDSTVPTHSAPPAEAILEDLPGLPADRHVQAPPASSLLTMALKGDVANPDSGNSFQKYAEFSGKGEAAPLWIKIYYAFAEGRPLEVPIRRQIAEDGPPKVLDLIGLALYRYEEEEREPKLQGADLKVASWELRMVDDGEVEMDFPALNATRPITDFTSNNNRPPQRRARDKPWDEFGLVRAKVVSEVDVPPAVSESRRESVKTVVARPAAPPLQPSMVSLRNPIMGPSFTLARSVGRKDSSNLLDAPAVPTVTSTPRTGPPKNVKIHFTDPQSFHTQHIDINTPADTYIAEVFDMACTRFRLDKALYVLKVRGTQTVAPSDRTVEALGANLHLDLARRRFGAVGDFGLGVSGSPGSTSPNAPLELVPNTPPIGKDARRRKAPGALALTQPGKGFHTMTASALNLQGVQDGRRYHVLRKLPLSFSATHPRTLVITPEFLQVLPAQNAEDGPVSGKVTNIHMSSIVGVKVSRKHPKMVRVVVYKEKEAKRYDFECVSKEEAQSIVADVRVGVGEYGSGAQGFS